MVHQGPGCIKAGTSCVGLGCRNDAVSSKPANVGKEVAEALLPRVTIYGLTM